MSKLRISFYYNEEASTSLVQSVDLQNGEISILAKFNGRQQGLRPELSPDGTQISLLYDAENELFDWMRSLGIIDLNYDKTFTFPPIQQKTFDLKLGSKKWTKDGRLLFSRYCGTSYQLYIIEPQSGELKQLTNASLSILKYAISPDGSKLVWVGIDAHGNQIVRVASSDGTNAQDLIVEPAVNECVALSEVLEIEWDTINYPTKMRGLLFLPNNYKKGTQYPLVIDIHGGGAGATIFLAGGILNDNPLEWQLWTSKGYAVLVPEFRSSTAFGYLAISRDELQEHDLVNCDMIDILAGLDELVKRGIVDNDRVAAIGHSAGGRRANWLTVASDRFQVIISKEGWADEMQEAMRHPQLWKAFGGSPAEVPENYLKNSALFHSKNATTPTLFLMGTPKMGGVDPYYTSQRLYEALKKQGVETKYIEYADEGHVFKQIANRRDSLKQTIEWIDRYIGPGLVSDKEGV